MKIPMKIIIFSICLVLPCRVIAQESATFVDTDRSSVTLLTDELQPDHLIFVDAVVGGKDRRLILDTGATCNVFNSRLEPDLGDPMGSTKGRISSGAARAFSRFKPIDVVVRGHLLDGGRFCVTTPLDHLERYVGEPVLPLMELEFCPW